MACVVVLLVMAFLSLLVHVVPGDPVNAILGPRANPELTATVRAEMKLDEPVPAQLYDFISHAMRGDLGEDFVSHVSVVSLIGDVLPHTIVLAVAGLALAVLIGIPLGVLAATRPNSWTDRLTGAISVSFITMPSYVAGLLLLLLFGVQLQWLPALGAGEFSDPLDYLRHLALPAIALAIAWVGYLARFVRASMLEVLGANYVRTAHAVGIHERLVFYKYALKNALIPTVALLGVGLGSLMGGAIFIELIFTRPGLGSLIFEAITTRNYTVVRGAVLVVALLFVVANLLADLLYRTLDPRVRVEERSLA